MSQRACSGFIFALNVVEQYLKNRTYDNVLVVVAESNKIEIEDINWFIPHQANIRMFQYISKSLKIPFERFYLTLQKYGNISSVSCAIALDEAVRNGSIQDKDLVCLPVFGGGLTRGSALIRW